MSTSSTDLELKGKAPFRRNLSLRLNEHGHFHASMYQISAHGSYQMLAWLSGTIADSHLTTRESGHSLWIDRAAFDVSDAEAQRIRETFEPLGLRIKVDPAPAPVQAEATVAAHP